MTQASEILQAASSGDPRAGAELFVLLYDELRGLAARKLAHEKPGQTLDPTGLVHEAYLRLLPGETDEANRDGTWQNRGHFFGAAAEAMRRILIERARKKAALKYGGAVARVAFNESLAQSPDACENLLDLDEALTALEAHDAQAAQVVKLRYFAGLKHQEAADALGITRRVADRLWDVARTWLYQRLNTE